MVDNLIDSKYLNKVLSYCELSGELRWKKRDRSEFSCDRSFKIFNSRFAGKIAGNVYTTKAGKSYRTVRVNRRLLLAHRIIWVMVTGDFPEHEIDHINGNSLDNRIKNLRDCNENCKNFRLFSNNKSGHAGVSWYKAGQVWEVRIGKVYIGRFNDKEEAISIRKKAEIEHGYHENHGQSRPL